MKKSTSRMQSDIKKEINRVENLLVGERSLAILWEEQGQYGTIHHDRIKLYSKALAKLEADVEDEGRDKGQGSEVNATSK